MKFTILGGSGFIGSSLATSLMFAGHQCRVPERDEVLALDGPLGHVVYCIGLTADFRERPYDTVEAHAGLLARFMRRAKFASFLYLSSTRVYRRSTLGEESTVPQVDPTDPMDLYDISKLTGEALCLGIERPQVRVARLSNVYGDDFHSGNFLSSVLAEIARSHHVRFLSSARSEKDYVHVDDVTWAIERIALGGRHRVYNVAGGKNVSNRAIAARLREIGAGTTEFGTDLPTVRMPPVSIERLEEEFGFAPRALADALPDQLASFRKEFS